MVKVHTSELHEYHTYALLASIPSQACAFHIQIDISLAYGIYHHHIDVLLFSHIFSIPSCTFCPFYEICIYQTCELSCQQHQVIQQLQGPDLESLYIVISPSMGLFLGSLSLIIVSLISFWELLLHPLYQLFLQISSYLAQALVHNGGLAQQEFLL